MPRIRAARRRQLQGFIYPELMQRITDVGVSIEELTLHVGMGTFAPVKTEWINEHIMHEESYFISEAVASRLAKSRHITAVGTTSVLESVASLSSSAETNSLRKFNAGSGSTNIFITPGYQYKAVDALITNFHLPKALFLCWWLPLLGWKKCIVYMLMP